MKSTLALLCFLFALLLPPASADAQSRYYRGGGDWSRVSRAYDSLTDDYRDIRRQREKYGTTRRITYDLGRADDLHRAIRRHLRNRDVSANYAYGLCRELGYVLDRLEREYADLRRGDRRRYDRYDRYDRDGYDDGSRRRGIRLWF